MKIKRENLVYGFLLLLPLIFHPWTGEVEILKLILLILLAVILSATQKSAIIKNVWVKWSIITLIVFGGIATLGAENLYLAFWGSWDRRFGYIALLSGILLASSLPKLKVDTLTKTLQISGTLSAVAAMLLSYTIPESLFEGRIGGTLGNPNILGGFLAVTVFINGTDFLKYLNSQKFPLKIFTAQTFLFCLYLIGLILQTYVLLETGSRSAWLALISVLVLYIILNNKNRVRDLLIFGLVSGLLLYFAKERLQDFTSLYTRLELYIDGIRAIIANPFGVGFEHEQYALSLSNTYELVPDRIHQPLLDVALSAGIPSALAALALTIFCFKALFQNPKTRNLSLAFLVLIISLQVNFFTIVTLALYFIFVGVAIKNVEAPIKGPLKNTARKNSLRKPLHDD